MNRVKANILAAGVSLFGLLALTNTGYKNTVELKHPMELVGLSYETGIIRDIKEKAIVNNINKLKEVEADSNYVANTVLDEIITAKLSRSEKERVIVTSSYVLNEQGEMEELGQNETLQEENVIDTGNYEYLGNFKLTSYCSCRKCSGKWGRQTESGAICEINHTVAVDKNVIPLGTWLEIYIPEQGWQRFKAEDTGSGVRGKHIDVYVGENHSLCSNPLYNTDGRQTAQVRILK